MIIVQLLLSVARGKVDISLLLGSQDEEEEKTTKQAASGTAIPKTALSTITTPTTYSPTARSSIPTNILDCGVNSLSWNALPATD